MPPPSEGSTGTQSGSGVAGGTHYAAVHNTSSRDIIMIGCTSDVSYNFSGNQEFKGGSDKRAGKYRQMEDYERIKTIRKEDLKLKRTIGCRSGYYVHAGHNEGRAVIVKVFSRGLGLSVQQRLKATAALSSELMHPNILHMEGISSLTSLVHFIVYEDVYWKNAEGPLAVALKVDLKRSITLGFKMVEGFSAGVDYLFAQGISLDLENLDVFLDVDDRFILSFTVPQLEGAESDAAQSQEPEDRAWRLFNALCEKTLLSANRVLHHEEIKRDPTVLDAVRPSLFAKNPVRSWSRSSPFSRSASSSDSSPQTEFEDELPLTLRREYVWRTVDRGKQSLAVVANQIALDLDLNLSPINRVNQTDGRNPHRCSGYLREEVTLATTTPDSAIVIYDTPSLLETCCICHEVVAIHETFRCRCGEPVPGSGRTVKCRECKLWSHSDCVGNPLKEFACGLCARSISSPAVYSARTSSAAPTSLAVQRPQVIVPTSTPSAPATPLLSASSLTMPNSTTPRAYTTNQRSNLSTGFRHVPDDRRSSTEQANGRRAHNKTHTESVGRHRKPDVWGPPPVVARASRLMASAGPVSGEVLEPMGSVLPSLKRQPPEIEYRDDCTGPPVNRQWIVCASVNNIEYGRGRGSTKASARERAAKMALLSLRAI